MKLDSITSSNHVYRSPSESKDYNQIISSILSGEYPGHYFTAKAEDSVGYFPSGILLEFDIPKRDLVPENLLLCTLAVTGDDELREQSVEQARKLQIPDEYINQILLYNQNRANELASRKTYKTLDGTIADSAVSVLRKINEMIDWKSQLALIHRNVFPQELVAVHLLNENDEYVKTITVNGESQFDSTPNNQYLVGDNRTVETVTADSPEEAIDKSKFSDGTTFKIVSRVGRNYTMSNGKRGLLVRKL